MLPIDLRTTILRSVIKPCMLGLGAVLLAFALASLLFLMAS